MAKFESWNFLQWLSKHFIALLVIQAISITLSIIFSSPYFIPKEYKSYTIVYPANMVDYAHESPSEQMLEFLNSVDIKNAVIAKFNLEKHYFGDRKVSYDKLYKVYDQNVVVSPTLFRAVELDITDISPDTAYEMVNYTLQVLNQKILTVQKEKATEVADMWRTQLDLKQHQIDSMTDISHQFSRQYGLVDYEAQSREVSKAYWAATATGKDSRQLSGLTQQLNNLEDYGIKFKIINQHIETAVDDQNLLETKYEDALKDVNKHYTYYNLISAPYKANSACYPLRWVIIILSSVSAFVFSILFISAVEKIRK
jgi:uncharacterized protein involved in exopolysaccharide biosynthesis